MTAATKEMRMAWMLLVIAGVLETGWAIGLKYSDGFTRPLPTVLTALALVASMVLLGVAVRDLPIGTAYAVWVGIGAFGAAVLGVVLFGEPLGPARAGFLVLLIVAIVGLRATSGS
jgi:quaternary ammonium compound-resistance protein SugE